MDKITVKALFGIPALKNKRVKFQTQLGSGPKAIPAMLSGRIIKNNSRRKSVEVLTDIGNRFQFSYLELSQFKSLSIH